MISLLPVFMQPAGSSAPPQVNLSAGSIVDVASMVTYATVESMVSEVDMISRVTTVDVVDEVTEVKAEDRSGRVDISR